MSGASTLQRAMQGTSLIKARLNHDAQLHAARFGEPHGNPANVTQGHRKRPNSTQARRSLAPCAHKPPRMRTQPDAARTAPHPPPPPPPNERPNPRRNGMATTPLNLPAHPARAHSRYGNSRGAAPAGAGPLRHPLANAVPPALVATRHVGRAGDARNAPASPNARHTAPKPRIPTLAPARQLRCCRQLDGTARKHSRHTRCYAPGVPEFRLATLALPHGPTGKEVPLAQRRAR